MEYLTDQERGSHKDLTDEELLRRSIKHPSLFGEILFRYQDVFLRKAYAVVKSREGAEDIVQETFTRIYLNAGRFHSVPGASFKSWAFKILFNTSFTHYQKKKKERAVRADIEPEFYDVLPDLTSQTEEKRELRDYLVSVFSRMPTHFSRVLTLHFLEGKSQEEIAKEEGTTVGAIKTRVHRAKQEFKKITTSLSL